MLTNALGGAECLLGAVPALDRVQLSLWPPAQLPSLGWAHWGLGLHGEPLGLGVNGGRGQGCLVPPSAWCRPRGDKSTGRKATECPWSWDASSRHGRAPRQGWRWRGAGGHGGAWLGVGVARGRSASRGRNSVGPVGLVGMIQAGWNGGLLQSGTGSPGSRQTPAFGGFLDPQDGLGGIWVGRSL